MKREFKEISVKEPTDMNGKHPLKWVRVLIFMSNIRLRV